MHPLFRPNFMLAEYRRCLILVSTKKSSGRNRHKTVTGRADWLSFPTAVKFDLPKAGSAKHPRQFLRPVEAEGVKSGGALLSPGQRPANAKPISVHFLVLDHREVAEREPAVGLEG